MSWKPQTPRIASQDEPAVQIEVVAPGTEIETVAAHTGAVNSVGANWLRSSGFKCTENEFALLPDEFGRVERVVACLSDSGKDCTSQLAAAKLFEKLPPGNYRLPECFLRRRFEEVVLSALFSQYRAPLATQGGRTSSECALLSLPEGPDVNRLLEITQGEFLCRDLINLPASIMGPDLLEKTASDIAKEFGSAFSVVRGSQLLEHNLNMIHAVGRAAEQAPRLLDMVWGKSGPQVVLIGKGVCFDSGGLNIKSLAGMRYMKKDMAGAATVLALARSIMALSLPLRLRVLIPAVENAISGNAMRPGDVLQSRNGLSVEITNTDAEGRLILADAISLADEQSPELVVTIATLTGAARIALGAELPAFFSTEQHFAELLKTCADETRDPVWQLPLWLPYRTLLNSNVADMANATSNGLAGAITAALFLKEFVTRSGAFLHFDIFGWSDGKTAGYSLGGKGQTHRALLATIQHWLDAV